MLRGIYLVASLRFSQLTSIHDSRPYAEQTKQIIETMLTQQSSPDPRIAFEIKRVRAIEVLGQERPEIEILLHLTVDVDSATPLAFVATQALKQFLKVAFTGSTFIPSVISIWEAPETPDTFDAANAVIS